MAKGKIPHREPVSRARMARRIIGVALWAGGIVSGIIGGDYSLPIALALFVIGFFLFVSAAAPKEKR
jgi:4-hydroxybenzoate polyprenyltransferase